MNRNPARPKRIMHPCTCASQYVECNCETAPKPFPPQFYIPLVVLAVSVVIVGLRYLIGG